MGRALNEGLFWGPLEKGCRRLYWGPQAGTLVTINEENDRSDTILKLLLWLLLCYHYHHGHDYCCSCRYCDQDHNALIVFTSFTGRRGLDQTDKGFGVQKFGVLPRASKWKKTRMWGAVVSRRVGGWARGALGNSPKP